MALSAQIHRVSVRRARAGSVSRTEVTQVHRNMSGWGPSRRPPKFEPTHRQCSGGEAKVTGRAYRHDPIPKPDKFAPEVSCSVAARPDTRRRVAALTSQYATIGDNDGQEATAWSALNP